MPCYIFFGNNKPLTKYTKKPIANEATNQAITILNVEPKVDDSNIDVEKLRIVPIIMVLTIVYFLHSIYFIFLFIKYAAKTAKAEINAQITKMNTLSCTLPKHPNFGSQFPNTNAFIICHIDIGIITLNKVTSQIVGIVFIIFLNITL